MTAFRSSLGEEGEDIATQLAENQREISIAEFFEKNKHMLGFDSGARALVTATKEAVDNSLDAIEEAGVLPDIYVEISEVDDYYRIVVEDNGPGITKEQIPKVFGKLLYGSRFHVREQSLLPDEHVMLRIDGEIVLRPIEDVWDDQAPSAVGEASLPLRGDVQAPCFDRDSGAVSWQDVTHVIRHGTDESTVRVRTDDGRSIAVTGNHSLFSVDSSGRIVEVRAGELEPGDEILVPHTIPSPADVSSINLVEELPANDEVAEPWIVHDIDPEVVEDLPHSTGEEFGDGETTAAIDGARDGSLDSSPNPEFEADANPPESGDKRSFLPLTTVRHLGLADRVSTGVITTSPLGGGSATGLPVTLELTPARLRTLGRVFARRAAASNLATMGLSHGSDAGVRRDGAGTEPSLIDVWEAIVGGGDHGLRLPAFVFRANARCQRAFLEGLTDGESKVDSTKGDARSWFETEDGDVGRLVAYLGTMVGAEPVWEERSVDDDAEIGRTVHRIGLRKDAIGVDDGVDAVTTDRKRGEDRRPSSSPDGSDGSRTTTAERPAVEPETRPLTTDGGTKVSSTHDVAVSSGRSGATTVGEVRLRTVVDVEPVRSTPYVYDLSVPGTGSDENFVAGNRGPVCVRNSRGQQGIGISAAVLYAQLTSGKPVRITSRTNGDASANYFELIIDTDSNEPEIKTSERTTWERTHGTRIELEMEANMRARTQLHDYIQQTAVVNPHARIEFHEPKGSWKFERATDELPAETSAIRPHPHGVELGTVIKMLKTTSSHSVSGFLREEFSRVGRKTADGILAAFRDRHFGREVAWSSPEDGSELARAIAAATANKTSEATAAFADGVRSGVEERQRIAHFNLETLVDNVADRIEEEFGETFGGTVRANAVEAAWEVIVADRRADLYGLIDDATSSRKDDATIDALAERLATKFDETGGGDDGDGGTDVDRRDRLTEKRLRTYVDRAADMTEEIDGVTVGETARENIVETIWGVMRTVPDEVPKVKEVAADRNAASDLVEAMRSVDVMAPPTDCLAPITDELIEAGLRKEYDAEFYAATTRGAGVHAGDPFVVEAGIAYGGELDPEGPVDILRFANRVPLVYQRGACAITDVVRGIGWRNYKLEQPGGSGIPNGPAVILVHVASTNVPFTSESKDAVANVPEIEDEIELAIREAAREMKRYLNKRQSLQQRKRKQSALATILPRMAEKLAEVTDRDPPNIDDALARIMNNVLVERRVEDGRIQIVVENHTSGAETVTLTDIVSAEPTDVEPDGASVVEMDGEWFVRHEATIASGERETLEYRLEDDGATYELDVDGVEDAKLTVTEEA